MTIYAIGDIHGQLAELDRVLSLIERDGNPQAEVIFLGDYTDRGPDSRGVLDRLMAGQKDGRTWTCLKGNHDRMFQRFLQDGTVADHNIKSGLPWDNHRLGGRATLESYGIAAHSDRSPAELFAAAQTDVPEAHLAFLAGLPLHAERDGLLFVHAGIRPGLKLDAQIEDDLIWIREPFLSDPQPHPWLVVHGHTALDAPEHFGNRVDLDGGAGYGRPLSAAVFEGEEVFLLSHQGRVPLRPTS
ncbi:metallophosphoesterase family protein [Pseudooceanicola sp. C21-150M6]|uniref:metallophosphoesterase family protein n=1 Tax=Pseudooceanicola sp. C21-150M6 TaxID=3434355 RepID=UPI003D7FE129